MDVGTEIFNRYYQKASSLGIVWTLGGWAEKNVFSENDNVTDEELEVAIEDWCETFEHREALQKLLAYEISYFIYRRLNGPWGEMVDWFWHERNRHVNEYREKTGYELVGNDIGALR